MFPSTEVVDDVLATIPEFFLPMPLPGPPSGTSAAQIPPSSPMSTGSDWVMPEVLRMASPPKSATTFSAGTSPTDAAMSLNTSPIMPATPQTPTQTHVTAIPTISSDVDSERDTAAKILVSPNPIADLDIILRTYYLSFSEAKLLSSPEITPVCPVTSRRRMNSITSAACAAKKTFGVSIMEHMTSHLSAELSSLAAHALGAGRADLALAARAAAISPEERRQRIANRVEAAAEAARVEKVAQKTDAAHKSVAATPAIPAVAFGAVKKGKRGARRKAMNCATAHKTNRIRKGMFDEFLSETERLVALRAKIKDAIRPTALDWSDLSLIVNGTEAGDLSADFDVFNMATQGPDAALFGLATAAPAC